MLAGLKEVVAEGKKRNIAIAQKSVDKLIEAGVTQNGG